MTQAFNRTALVAAAVIAGLTRHVAEREAANPVRTPPPRPDLRLSPIGQDVERIRQAEERRAAKTARQAKGIARG